MLLLVILFPPAGLIAGPLLVLFSRRVRNRVAGSMLTGAALAAGAMLWNATDKLNEEIDRCDDSSSGRYVGRDHPACIAARS